MTDHNYNMGTLHIDGNRWTVVAPTIVGPQRYSAGGEIALWISNDNGYSWNIEKMMTTNSQMNHNYVRRIVNAREDFSFIWSAGNSLKASKTSLYYSNLKGDRVIKMP